MNDDLLRVAAGLLGLLLAAEAVAWALRRCAGSPGQQRLATDVTVRVHAWWWLAGLGVGALLAGPAAVLALFLLVSGQALREYAALAPAAPGCRPTAPWVWFAALPLAYLPAACARSDLAQLLVPVWCAAFLLLRPLAPPHSERERLGRQLWGALLCAWGLVHVPLLAALPGPRSAELALWLLLVTQLGDVMQYIAGKLCGRHALAPQLSPGKTWEGLLGGAAGAAALGAGLAWLTPFAPLPAAGLALLVTAAAVAGGLAMSAAKPIFYTWRPEFAVTR